MASIVLKQLLDCQSSNNRIEEQQALIDGFSREDVSDCKKIFILLISCTLFIKYSLTSRF